MKLTRYDLIHAKDVQLAAIGVRRKQNSGWLKSALAKEFTEAQVKAFQDARTAKLRKLMSEPSVIEREAARPPESSIGTGPIATRFLAGESVIQLSEDYGIRVSDVERALRFELRRNAPAPAKENSHESPEDYANQIFENNRPEFLN